MTSSQVRPQCAPAKVGSCELRQQYVQGLVAEKIREHRPGTRKWVFSLVQAWASDADKSKLFWLMGRARTGKSAVSAKLLEAELLGEQVVAFHFSATTSPVALLTSLAAQLCASTP